MDLGPEPSLAYAPALVDGLGGHPDVYSIAGDVAFPIAPLQIGIDQIAREAEIAADGLAHFHAVQHAGHGEGDVVGNGAIVLVAAVVRGHVVVALANDRVSQELDPLGGDAPEVGVHHDAGFGSQRPGGLEDGPEGAALARETLVLGGDDFYTRRYWRV